MYSNTLSQKRKEEGKGKGKENYSGLSIPGSLSLLLVPNKSPQRATVALLSW